uniref:Uncharacterized protein n=1 Tax=Cucumis melo TaxID=3656 RepID=A0A9I9D5W4_CUCME
MAKGSNTQSISLLNNSNHVSAEGNAHEDDERPFLVLLPGSSCRGLDSASPERQDKTMSNFILSR